MTKRRLFWLGMGLAAGSVLAQRANQAAERLAARPASRELGQGLRNLAAGLGEFGAEFRTSRRLRERQLTQLVERRTGIPLPTIGGTLFPDSQHGGAGAGARPGSVLYGPGAVPPKAVPSNPALAQHRPADPVAPNPVPQPRGGYPRVDADGAAPAASNGAGADRSTSGKAKAKLGRARSTRASRRARRAGH